MKTNVPPTNVPPASRREVTLENQTPLGAAKEFSSSASLHPAVRRGHAGAARVTLLLVVLALAVVVGVFFIFTRPHSATPTTSLPELHRTNLLLTAGAWCLRDSTNSFTGLLLDTYGDGAKKSRTEISNGLPHGVSLGWHTNGQRQVHEHFVAGTSHGLRTKWHANGQKLSEVNVANGKLEGTFRRWDESGARAEEIEMKDGQPEGISRAYFPSGFLKAEARLRAGQVLARQVWPDGTRASGD